MGKNKLDDLIDKIIEQLRPIRNASDRLVESVIARLESQLGNPKPIDYIDDIFRIMDRNDLCLENKNNVCKYIGEYTDNFYNAAIIENNKAKVLKEKYEKHLLLNSIDIVEPKTITISNKSNSKNNEVDFKYAEHYLKLVMENKTDLYKVSEILLNISNGDKVFICQRIALKLRTEINQMINMLNDKDANYTKKEIEEFREDIVLYNELYSFVVNNFCSSNETTMDIVENKKKIVFPQFDIENNIFKSGDNPEEYYISFLNLLESLEKGTNINFRKFSNHGILNGLMEMKGYQSRIIYDYFDRDAYAIVTAFVKKSDWDKKIENLVESAIVSYLKYKKSVKNILSSEETKRIFYEEQARTFDGVKTYLRNNARGKN